MNKLRTGDMVMVISGKNKGKIAKISKIKDIKKKRGNLINTYVYLDGVNVAKKSKKGQGFVDVTLPIHISNVKYYEESLKKVSKISILLEKGKKYRFLKNLDKKLDK